MLLQKKKRKSEKSKPFNPVWRDLAINEKKEINCRKRNSTRDMLLRGWQQGQHFIIYAASLHLRREKKNRFPSRRRTGNDALTIFKYSIHFYCAVYWGLGLWCRPNWIHAGSGENPRGVGILGGRVRGANGGQELVYEQPGTEVDDSCHSWRVPSK